jgi:hypothetical protein
MQRYAPRPRPVCGEQARVKGIHCEERSDEAIPGSVLQSSSICSWIVSLRSQ